jgi:alpha-D-ribose 1-methylphosphonate 5-triphosphate diphosphatase PhnM
MAAPVFCGPRKGKSESWFDVAVLEMDGDVDRVPGRDWDALAAKSVIDEPLLSVGVATVFDVVAAGTSAPNGTVVLADIDSDVDVWFASSASSSLAGPAVLCAACSIDNSDLLLASADIEDLLALARDSQIALMAGGGDSNLGLG